MPIQMLPNKQYELTIQNGRDDEVQMITMDHLYTSIWLTFTWLHCHRAMENWTEHDTCCWGWQHNQLLSIETIQSNLPWFYYNEDYVPNPNSLELQLESTCIALQSFHVIKPNVPEDSRESKSGLGRTDLKCIIATRNLLVMGKNRETGLARLDLNYIISTRY